MPALSARAGVVLIAISTLSVGWFNSATIAQAFDECGPAVGGVVSCTIPDPGEFASGIEYVTATGLTINVGANIVVTRNPVGNDFDGVRLSGSGAGDLVVNVATGAVLTTRDDNSDPVAVQSNGILTGNIYIQSGGSINVLDAGAGSGVGLYGKVNDVLSTGSVEITNLTTGVITATTTGSRGMEGTQVAGALGAVSLYNYGTINIDTPPSASSAGMVGWIMGGPSTADIQVHLGSTGRINLRADDGTGLFVAQDGLGNGIGTVAGSINTVGSGSAGAYVYISNAASVGSADLTISETGRISITGTNALGAAAVTLGDGTTLSPMRGQLPGQALESSAL